MNKSMNNESCKTITLLISTLLVAAAPANADVQATLQAIGPYQEGVEGRVHFGTVLHASTRSMGSLWGSASFRIECDDQNIRPPLHGSRSWSDNGLVGPRQIVVTAPEWLPAREYLPGWRGVMGGTLLSCTYTQTGMARTSVLPFGAGGGSIPLGGDSWERTEVIPFGMIKPGSESGGLCIM